MEWMAARPLTDPCCWAAILMSRHENAEGVNGDTTTTPFSFASRLAFGGCPLTRGTQSILRHRPGWLRFTVTMYPSVTRYLLVTSLFQRTPTYARPRTS